MVDSQASLSEAIAMQGRNTKPGDAPVDAYRATRDAIADQIRQKQPSAQLFGTMGQIYSHYKCPAVAAGYNLLAASLDPGNVEFQIALGTALLEEQQHGAALQCFRRAAQLDSASTGAREGILKICSHLGVTVSKTDHVKKLPPVLRWRIHFEQASMPLALFLAKGITEDHCLIGSFEEASNWNYLAFDLHTLGKQIGPCIDLFLLQFAKDMNVDHVFMEFAQLSRRNFDPRPETLHMIRKKTRASVGLFPCETVKPISTTLVQIYRTAIDFVAAIDAPLNPDMVRDNETLTILNLWAPPNPAYFYQSSAQRIHDASFVGQTKRQQRFRERMLNYLRDRGVNVTIAGIDENRWLNQSDYADLMRQSKIVINFSRAMVVSMWDREPHDGRLLYAHHTKARVFEAMHCGALLLEQENPLIQRFFEPYVHYVPFSNEQHLHEQIVKYLNDDTARTAIANAGHERAKSEFSAAKFWRTVLECAERFRSRRSSPNGAQR